MQSILDNFVDECYLKRSNGQTRDDHYASSKPWFKLVAATRKDLKPTLKTTRTCQEIAADLERKAALLKLSARLSLKLRYQILTKFKSTCLLCGKSTKDGVTVEVDHIKPISKYPELTNDPDNLQVLCTACNLGKRDTYEDDLR